MTTNNSSSITGREKELAQLNSFLWPAIAGQGKVVFVTSRAETNSRAFVEAVLSQVQSMHPTLTVALGECRQGGQPYLPFAEIMRLLTGDVTGDLEDNAISASNADRLRGLLKGSGAALLELGPDLIDTFVPGSGLLANASLFLAGSVPWLDRLRRRQQAGPQVRQERLEEGRLFEEYGDVLAAIARQQPLALSLLDLQWADEGSIGLLFHLSRRIKDLPTLIIGTYRPDEVAAGRAGKRHPLESTVNEIVRYFGPITIPLDPPEVQETVQREVTRRLADRVAEIAPRPAVVEEAPPAIEWAPEAVPFVEEQPVFVGRERELTQLQSFLDAALQGKGQVLFVTGEPGAGKSTLVQEFTYRAQSQDRDLVVAIGECNAQTGAGDAYLPFREVLGLLTGDVEAKLAEQAISYDNADRLRGLLRWSGQALVEFGPDLIDIFVPGSGLLVRGTTLLAEKTGWADKVGQLVRRRKEEPGVGQEGLEQSHLFEQYTNVICRLAERNPLLLVLDDLQWADEASIALLFHLGRRIADRQILVMSTYRPNDVALGRDGGRHPLEPVVAELKRYYARIEVNLDHAAEEADALRFVSEYVDAAYSPHRLDGGFKELIFRRTEGHALFTVELLRDLRERDVLTLDADGFWYQAQPVRFEDLPARVDAVIGERIARLEAEARDILTCASVEGEDFTAQVVARVQNLDERQLARRLARELDKKHHLVGEGGRERVGRQRLFLWRFRHALFQDHLYRDLSEMERMMLHEDVGTCLEELYGDEAGRIAVQLWRHFLEAGIYEKAFEYLKLAGEQARARYANEEAIGYFRKALEVAGEIPDDLSGEQMVIHERLGDVLVNVGEYDQALENYGAALDLLETWPSTHGAVELRAALCRKAGMIHERKGDYARALEWLTQARELLGEEGSSEMARICLSVAGVLYRQGETAQSLDWCQRGLDIAQEGVRRGEPDGVPNQGTTFFLLDIAQEGVRRGELAHAYMLRSTIYGDLGDLDRAISDGLQSLEICDETGDLAQAAKAHNGLGAHYYYRGDWEPAVEHYRQSREIRERIGNVRGVAVAANNLGELHLIQGRLDEAAECFQQCLETWERTGWLFGVPLSYRNLAQVYIKRGEWRAALEYLEMSLEILEEMGARDWLVAEVYRHLAEVHLGLGQLDKAHEYCDRALEVTVTQEIKLMEGGARRVLGQVQRCAGRWHEAEASLQHSLELSKELGLRYDEGQALWELALLYRDWAGGDDEGKAKATRALDGAMAIFEQLGAQWDLDRARAMKTGLGTETRC